MQHLDEGTIHSWLDGALSADEAARVEAHVKECAQCQAAVAEARGFIAASSRILTALDNAPRGVIPAAKPKQRIDPIVWRVAATVLVVAAGTLVVVRKSGLTERANDKSTVQGTAVQTASKPTPSNAPLAETVATAAPAAGKAAATNTSEADFSGRATNQTASAGAAAPQESRVNRRADEGKPAALGAIGGRAPNRESGDAAVATPLAAAAPPPPLVLRGRVAGLTAMDAMAEEPRVRVVGTPRGLGQKLTLYEVAPGDTVLLAEQLNMELQSVVTGAAMAPRAMAVESKERTRAAAKVGAVADTPRTTPAQAPIPVPATPLSFTQAADGSNSLTWRDAETGNVMKLSGRHSREELEQIKRRIERAKSATADSAKKNP